jgi:hypothetical protein
MLFAFALIIVVVGSDKVILLPDRDPELLVPLSDLWVI